MQKYRCGEKLISFHINATKKSLHLPWQERKTVHEPHIKEFSEVINRVMAFMIITEHTVSF